MSNQESLSSKVVNVQTPLKVLEVSIPFDNPLFDPLEGKAVRLFYHKDVLEAVQEYFKPLQLEWNWLNKKGESRNEKEQDMFRFLTLELLRVEKVFGKIVEKK